MIDLAALQAGTMVRDCEGRLVATIEPIRAGVIRLEGMAEWSTRDACLDLDEAERLDGAGLHLKRVAGRTQS